MAPAKWRAELGIEKWEDEETKGKMAIKMEDGGEEEMLIEVRGSGWVKDCESGRSIRMKRLGRLRSLSAKKEKEKKEGKKLKRKTCEECGDEFPNEVSWQKHLERGWCKKMEDISEKELRTRRVTRDTAARKRGEKIMDVEPVEVRSCNGGMATPCGSFVYLGSLTTAKCSSGPETRSRILKAGVVCRNCGGFGQ